MAEYTTNLESDDSSTDIGALEFGGESSLETSRTVAAGRQATPVSYRNMGVFSRRKALVISAAVMAVVVILSGGAISFKVRQRLNEQSSAQSKTSVQDAQLDDAKKTSIPNELEVGTESLLVNGDIITRGELKITAGEFQTSLVPSNLTADQQYLLPNASGTICLNSNNCNFVTQGQLQQSILGPTPATPQAATPVLTAPTVAPTPTAGTSGATVELNNLSNVAINTSLLPGSTTIDLGSALTPFRDLYLSSNANVAGILTASALQGNGSGITNLNASNLSTGIVNNARLTGSGALTIIAGGGLIDGGSVALGGSMTLNIGAGDGITVNADNIAVDSTVCRASSSCAGYAPGDGGNYIQNQVATFQSANFQIQSADSDNIGAVIKGATGQTADLFQLQSDTTVNPVLGVAADGSTVFRNAADSAAAFSIQNAAGVDLLVADTAGDRLLVTDVVPLTAGVVTGTTILTVAGNVGADLDMKLGTDDFGRISYYDSTLAELKFVKCSNDICSVKEINTVDTTGPVGRQSSLALNSAGLPRISYITNRTTGADLLYAVCSTANCAGTVTVTPIALGGASDVGFYNKLALDPVTGFARMIYQDAADHLQFVYCTNLSCSTKITNQIGTDVIGGNTTGASALIIGPDNLPRIAYYDTTLNDVKYVRCSDPSCSNPVIPKTLASTGDVGSSLSMTLGSDGLARVAYSDLGSTQRNFKYIKCADPDCNSFSSPVAITPIRALGTTPSLQVDSQDLPRLAYRSTASGDVMYVRCLNPTCTSVAAPVNIDSRYNVNTVRLAITSSDLSRIAYNDVNVNILKYASLNTESGSEEVIGGSNLGTIATPFSSLVTHAINLQGGLVVNNAGRSLPAISISGGGVYLDIRDINDNKNLYVSEENFSYVASIPKTNSFQIGSINSGGGSDILFNVDTTNKRIGINNTAPAFTLDVTGVIRASDALRVGTFTNNGEVVFVDSVSDFTTTIQNSTLTVGDRTLRIPDTAGVSDEFCLLALGNCAGPGNGITGTGTTGTIPKFTGTSTIGNSILSDNGSTVTVGGNLSVTGTATLPTLIVTNATITGTLTVSGHIVTSNASGTTTITAGPAACTAPSVSLSGNDVSGTITITTGTGCASLGTLGIITFANAYGAVPRISITPSNNNATDLKYYTANRTTTGFDLATNVTPTDSITYSYDYLIQQ